ncbi:MAG: DUF2075 domain-containing protein, partial [Marinoscillum sp.]
MKQHLQGLNGSIFFEFSIPRMGKRVDVIIIVESLVIIIEFKVGSSIFDRSSIDQVWDYALDLKNFHKPSHNAILAPMLVCTESKTSIIEISTKGHNDNLLVPIKLNSQDIRKGIDKCLDFFHKANKKLTSQEFSEGSYFPTPTIIEAAISLYKSHSVDQITRSDSGAKNLSITTNEIISLIQTAKAEKKKFICFVTGVPGAGKTLVGLKVATDQLSEKESNSSVYLSGNGPLVKVLQEALARDRVKSQKSLGLKVKKSDVKASVK